MSKQKKQHHISKKAKQQSWQKKLKRRLKEHYKNTYFIPFWIMVVLLIIGIQYQNKERKRLDDRFSTGYQVDTINATLHKYYRSRTWGMRYKISYIVNDTLHETNIAAPYTNRLKMGTKLKIVYLEEDIKKARMFDY